MSQKKETQFQPVDEILSDKYSNIIDKNRLTSVMANAFGVIYDINKKSTIFRSFFTTTDKNSELILKIGKDTSLNIESIPKLVSVVPYKKYIYEFREYEGKARLIDTNYLLIANKYRKYKWIGQIIDLSNELRRENLVLKLFTLDDISKSCFLDENDDIHLFNTSYVDIDDNSYHSLQSVGFLIYQIFGGKIEISKEDNDIVFDDSISQAWREYVKICCSSKNTKIQDLYSKFVEQSFPLTGIDDIEGVLSNSRGRNDEIKLMCNIIPSNDIKEAVKAKIVQSICQIYLKIIKIFERHRKIDNVILSPDSLTCDTIGITANHEICIINSANFFINSHRDDNLNISFQVLNRIGYLIYQMYSNELIKNIPEYNENVAFPYNDELPLYVKMALFSCLYNATFYQQNYFYKTSNDLFNYDYKKIIKKIHKLMEKKPGSIMLSEVLL